MKYPLLLVSILLFKAILVESSLKSTPQLKDSITLVDAQAGSHIRAFSANWWPSVNPNTILLTGASVQKTGENSGELDAVLFALSTFWQTSLVFGYVHGTATVTPPTSTTNATADVEAAMFAFALRFFKVFEYTEVNNQPGYQIGGDLVTGEYDLSSPFLSWKPMQIDTQNITDSDGTRHTVFIVSIETSDEVFFLRFTASGYPAEVNGVKISPDSVKIDIAIKWFNNPLFTGITLYSTGPSSSNLYPNAQVALFGAMAASAGTVSAQTTGTGAQNPTLSFTDTNFVATFDWEAQAEVNVSGVAIARAVTATVVDSTDSLVNAAFKAGWILKLMIFSFAGSRPSEVAWDPTIGASIDYDAINNGSFLQPSFALIAIIAFYLLKRD